MENCESFRGFGYIYIYIYRGNYIYPSMVCLKFNLLACGFIFDTLPTRDSFRICPVIHL